MNFAGQSFGEGHAELLPEPWPVEIILGDDPSMLVNEANHVREGVGGHRLEACCLIKVKQVWIDDDQHQRFLSRKPTLRAYSSSASTSLGAAFAMVAP